MGFIKRELIRQGEILAREIQIGIDSKTTDVWLARYSVFMERWKTVNFAALSEDEAAVIVTLEKELTTFANKLRNQPTIKTVSTKPTTRIISSTDSQSVKHISSYGIRRSIYRPDSYEAIYQDDSSLRDYQKQAKIAIFKAWDSVDSVMFQMPTGTGKTRLFSSIIRDIHDHAVANHQFHQILIVAHRQELIEQIHDTLQNHYHLSSGYIAGGYPREKNYHIQVASIQTISHKNNLEYAESLNFDYVIIDEAHHAKAETYQRLWKLYPDAKRLGVTATPWRMSGAGFTDLFDNLIISWTIRRFIDERFLSTYLYYSLSDGGKIQKAIDNIDEFDIEGDYKVSALERVMDRCEIRAQLLDTYLTFVKGKKGIIYSICQEHSRHICEEFAERGVKIASIDSKTPKAERKQLVSDFRAGRLEVLVNVDIFSEGFDCPDIEFVQLARPTCSLAKYLQQVGRALRPKEGKEAAIILDNVGAYSRFGLPDANRQWRHHFLGQKDAVEPVTIAAKKSNGSGRVFELEEGHEPMVLVQQVGELMATEMGTEEILQQHYPIPEGYTIYRESDGTEHAFRFNRSFIRRQLQMADAAKTINSHEDFETYVLDTSELAKTHENYSLNKREDKKRVQIKDNHTDGQSLILDSIPLSNTVQSHLDRYSVIEPLGIYRMSNWDEEDYAILLRYMVKERWQYIDYNGKGERPEPSLAKIVNKAIHSSSERVTDDWDTSCSGQRWRKADDTMLVQLHLNNTPLEDIARHLKRTSVAVGYRLQQKGYLHYDSESGQYLRIEQLSENRAKIQYYKTCFTHLKRAVVGSEKAPHKLIFLLSICDYIGYKCGLGKSFEKSVYIDPIPFASIEKRFNDFWPKYVHSETFRPTFIKPLIHMQDEPFFRLISRKNRYGREVVYSGHHTMNAIQDAYVGMQIDKDLMNLLTNSEFRLQIINFLIDLI